MASPVLRPPVEMVDFDIAVFDMDGTLYSTDLSIVPAVIETFADLGLPEPPVEEIEDLIGRPDVHYHMWLKEHAGEHGDIIVDAVSKKEVSLVNQRGYLYPKTREMLEELRAMDVRTALLTNAGRGYCMMVLETFEIHHLFDAVSWYESGDGGKTERLRDIIQGFGGGTAVMVGDRFYDFEAAQEVGCTSIGVAHGFGNDELESADIVVKGLWAIVELKLRAVVRKREGHQV
ncbi:MAG: HAD family hydrolase [Thermoplasmata archaeon]|nr:MAG: HAD family hydrolase [Thermoplasmata archaeon]